MKITVLMLQIINKKYVFTLFVCKEMGFKCFTVCVFKPFYHQGGFGYVGLLQERLNSGFP